MIASPRAAMVRAYLQYLEARHKLKLDAEAKKKEAVAKDKRERVLRLNAREYQQITGKKPPQPWKRADE